MSLYILYGVVLVLVIAVVVVAVSIKGIKTRQTVLFKRQADTLDLLSDMTDLLSELYIKVRNDNAD